MPPIDARTHLVAVLGHPIGHSLSPAIHNAAFEAQGLNFRYVAFAVRPEDLASAIEGIRALQLAGANVTIPHKQAVSAYLDELTPDARAVGAVNTVVRLEDDAGVRLRGDNTDIEGFIRPLLPLAERLRNQSAVVFGSGGATRAVVFGLLSRLELDQILIVARNRSRAEALCEAFGRLAPKTWVQWQDPRTAGEQLRRCALVVNATPLGMAPATEGSVWERAEDFSAGQVVYDLVYNPARTKLLRLAGDRGATTIDGRAMFIGQAAAAFRQWTGREMPLDVARLALTAALEAAG